MRVPAAGACPVIAEATVSWQPYKRIQNSCRFVQNSVSLEKGSSYRVHVIKKLGNGTTDKNLGYLFNQQACPLEKIRARAP